MDRATAVVRGTHSANFYEVPLLAPVEQPAFAATWGPSSSTKSPVTSTSSFASSGGGGGLRRGANARDINASFHRGSSRASTGRNAAGATEAPQFQPAFAFDVDALVSSLRRSSSSSSSSLPSGAHGWQNRFTQRSQHGEQLQGSGDARTEAELPRRGRRDALSGNENSQAQPPQGNPNSIIAYSLNRRKKKPIVGMPTSAAPPSPAPGGAPHHYHQHQHQQQYSTPSSTTSRTPSPPPQPSSSSSTGSSRPSHYYHEFRPTTTIITPNGIEYTTEVPTRTTRVTSFYEESFTF